MSALVLPPFDFSNVIKQGLPGSGIFINLHSLFFAGVLLMAKGKNPKKATAGIPVKADTVSIEKETIQRIGRTLATIEDFLAKWDESDLKPDKMLPQVAKIRQFHDALVVWQKNAILSQEKGNEESRLKRLHDFVNICNSYS